MDDTPPPPPFDPITILKVEASKSSNTVPEPRTVVTHMHIADKSDIDIYIPEIRRSLHSIKSISIINSSLTSKNIDDIFKNLYANQLEEINFAGNFFGSEGIQSLARNINNLNIKNIDLSFNGLTCDSINELIKNCHLSNLIELSLEGNLLNDKGGQELLNSFRFRSLKKLNMARCGIGEDATIALANNNNFSQLQILNLEENNTGDNGAIAISKSPYLASLLKIDLQNNNITDLGAKYIGLSYKLSSLEIIILFHNKITSFDVNRNTEYDRIRRHFTRYDEGTNISNDIRVFIVGHPNSGKTTCRKSIHEANYLAPDENLERTLGIDVSPSPWIVNIDDHPQSVSTIHVYTWDFAGHEIQYMCHQYFLKRGGLYILLISHDTTLDQIHYWLNTISMLAPGAKLVPILNKFRDTSNEIYIWEHYKSHILNKYDLNFIREIEVDFKIKKSIDTLKRTLSNIIGEIELQPINKDYLEGKYSFFRYCRESKKKYLNREEFEQICNSHLHWENKKENYKNDFLDHLDFIGDIIYLRQIELIVIDINWLLKGLYTLLPPLDSGTAYNSPFFNKIKTNKGHFSRADLFDAWSGMGINEIEKHRLFSALLHRSLDIIYPLTTELGEYFCPCYLPENKNLSDIFKDTSKFPSWTIGIGLPYMPSGFFSRIIVRLSNSIQTNEINSQKAWINIAYLTSKTSGNSDKCDNDSIIFIQGTNIWISVKKETDDNFFSRRWIFMMRILSTIEELASEYLDNDYKVVFTCNQCNMSITSINDLSFIALSNKEIESYYIRNGITERVCPTCEGRIDLREYFEPPSGFHKKELEEAKNRSAQGEITMNINNSTIHGDVIQAKAKTMNDCFNKINESNINNDIKSLIEELLIKTKEIGDNHSVETSEILREADSLTSEITSSNPRKKYLEISFNGIVEAAKKIGAVGTPLISIAEKLFTLIEKHF
ncbi:COR domain-containing protein [Hahella sp. NBU794]|uniref:COR domain-containing protein n=1 Tax=Hahella sp. NBU794 TaxID=3422590 RepID=UPI003D6F8552